MTFIEALLLLQGTGIAGMGVGALKWAMRIDKRVTVIETMLKIKES